MKWEEFERGVWTTLIRFGLGAIFGWILAIVLAQIFGMDYCQDDCALALEQIARTISEKNIDILVGSSLGGFLTILTTGIERYAVNPCYRPSAELPKLGPQNGLPAPSPEMTATYAAAEPRLRQLDEEDRKRVHVLMGDKDELLGDRYFRQITEDLGHRPGIVFSTHHLSESAAETICSLIGKGNRMLSDAHKYATANESLVKRSTRCGCFNCMDTYPPEEILDWIDDKDGRTAVCPHCFVDAVLPDSCPYSISPYFLRRMNRKWL